MDSYRIIRFLKCKNSYMVLSYFKIGIILGYSYELRLTSSSTTPHTLICCRFGFSRNKNIGISTICRNTYKDISLYADLIMIVVPFPS
mmetsp:Transcript_29498/g.5333  ORF Transcript_29498/g.5333 Transcript_29498/m.5333 type:complete len:88 (-) Transcript_29498:3617-3880(-)